MAAFVAVAESLHFGRAAAHLHVGQSTLSEQIKRLEAEVGVSLLQRDSRNVDLTAAGRSFLERCRAILGDVATALDHTRSVGAGEVGHLTIGYVGSTLYGPVPALISRFREERTGIGLGLVERKTAQQLEAMRTGTQDVGVIHRAPGAMTGFHVQDLQVEGLQVAVPATFPLARPGPLPVQVRELDGLPLVIFPRDLEPDTYDRILGLFQAHGARPRIIQEATGLHTLMGLVATGMGLAFVTDEVARNLARPGVVCRPVVASPRITTAIAWPVDASERNPAVGPLVAHLRRTTATSRAREVAGQAGARRARSTTSRGR